eukprot:Gregarina_sp_Poly_1__5636@NODE_2973_length_1489_cov_8_305204_g1877_i0_p1_GENE_NODE_2973_length_1489_cov_8_305204_g1877_i0NODE_2973_length_1489_cov_8_305204_g1877_i0_p1_ORF_typecomplete_len180_score21_36_NODE_2973_length_1489_cov_8_305204_g1877_i021560
MKVPVAQSGSSFKDWDMTVALALNILPRHTVMEAVIHEDGAYEVIVTKQRKPFGIFRAGKPESKRIFVPSDSGSGVTYEGFSSDGNARQAIAGQGRWNQGTMPEAEPYFPSASYPLGFNNNPYNAYSYPPYSHQPYNVMIGWEYPGHAPPGAQQIGMAHRMKAPPGAYPPLAPQAFQAE